MWCRICVVFHQRPIDLHPHIRELRTEKHGVCKRPPSSRQAFQDKMEEREATGALGTMLNARSTRNPSEEVALRADRSMDRKLQRGLRREESNLKLARMSTFIGEKNMRTIEQRAWQVIERDEADRQERLRLETERNESERRLRVRRERVRELIALQELERHDTQEIGRQRRERKGTEIEEIGRRQRFNEAVERNCRAFRDRACQAKIAEWLWKDWNDEWKAVVTSAVLAAHSWMTMEDLIAHRL